MGGLVNVFWGTEEDDVIITAVDRVLTLWLCKVHFELMCAQVALFKC